MATSAEICKYIRRWIAGEIPLREFEDWFVPATWDSYKNADQSIQELVDEIELNLSEYSDGLLNDEQLRRELSKIVDEKEPNLNPRQEYPLIEIPA